MSLERLYPTEHEAKALAALVPKNQRSFIPVEDGLLQLVQFCQQDEVRNFLFNRDPFQLTYLSNPHIAKNAVSGMLTSTKVENSPTRYFSDHVRSAFFMAPVFSCGSLNFGFGVSEYLYNPATFWDTLNPGYFGRVMTRFVRDDEKGIMVVVLDFRDEDRFHVDFTQLVKTTGQIHSTANFQRRKFLDIYESGTFDLASLTTALLSLQVSCQVRECPVCRTTEQCNCHLPAISPRHPFDISAFYKNMEYRLGTFEGVANFTMYQNGRSAISTAVGSRSSVSGGIDINLIERLQRWAICESSSAEDPRQSLITYNNDVGVSSLLPSLLDVTNDQPLMFDNLTFVDLNDDWYGNQDDARIHITGRVFEDAGSQPGSTEARSQGNVGDLRNETVDMTSVSQGAKEPGRRESTVGERTSLSESRNASTTPSKSDSDDRELVKKLRAELRKERNRASAQRSNLRRKAENDARRQEIKTNKEKAVLLRAKEMMLRQENMKLRQKLAEQSSANE